MNGRIIEERMAEHCGEPDNLPVAPVASKRRRPGEIVRRKPGSCFVMAGEPSLVRLSDESDGRLPYVDSCMVCDDPECREWGNVQIVDGPYKGQWMCHLSECQMEDDKTKVRMSLVGLDGNAFSLLGAFASAARRQGWTREEIAEVRADAMAGDYDHLLCVLMDHCEEDADELAGQ